MIKTPEQYVESLRDGRVVYQSGKRIDDITKYPPYRNEIQNMAQDYYVSLLPEYRSLFNIIEEGEECSFAYHELKTPEDVQRRREIVATQFRMRVISPRFTGIDALNGIAYACHKMDVAAGTHYGERIDNYRKWCQKNDPSILATMSDPKGHRMLQPEDPRQKHKDFSLRIVDRNKDGIFINGCKVHISFAVMGNELLVMPSRNHGEAGKDYALSCAVSCNAKGLKIIGSDPAHSEGGGHPMVVFDNVFVPNERVFLAGEWPFSQLVTYSFARFHRLSSATYQYVALQNLAGLAMLMAEYNGLTRATRIRDMLAWFAMQANIVEALSKAAAVDAEVDPETGLALPNEMYSNCAKFFASDNHHQAIKYLHDITGGIAATMPSWQDWENPETRPYIDKYLGGDAQYPTEERIKALRAVNEHATSFLGLLAVHAEGSLAAQKMMIYHLADWDRFKAAAKYFLDIPTDHPAFKDLPKEPLWKFKN